MPCLKHLQELNRVFVQCVSQFAVAGHSILRFVQINDGYSKNSALQRKKHHLQFPVPLSDTAPNQPWDIAVSRVTDLCHQNGDDDIETDRRIVQDDDTIRDHLVATWMKKKNDRADQRGWKAKMADKCGLLIHISRKRDRSPSVSSSSSSSESDSSYERRHRRHKKSKKKRKLKVFSLFLSHKAVRLVFA